jgi:tRNA pseudouridine32 synthase / 23S rRNA pseudouridine746 synthase
MLLTDRVIFIDAEALIIDKPAGLPVDTPRDGSLSVESHRQQLAFGFHRWPTAVHRLDRDTSGCLLLARNERAHRRFQQAFEAGEVEKRYLAVLDGVPSAPSGRIDLPLSKRSTAKDGWRMVSHPGGKTAVTNWTLIASEAGRALVEFAPETGRTHQLRVHAASGIGIPIVGDPVYGRGGTAMLLHASTLSVARPGKDAAAASAPLPPAFGAFCNQAVKD